MSIGVLTSLDNTLQILNLNRVTTNTCIKEVLQDACCRADCHSSGRNSHVADIQFVNERQPSDYITPCMETCGHITIREGHTNIGRLRQMIGSSIVALLVYLSLSSSQRCTVYRLVA
jgi:hypothetical protein